MSGAAPSDITKRLIPSSEPYWDLGTYSRRITTSSADCQAWFDRGLMWCYGFHHEEATTCFEHALAHDPACPMAYWGLVYSLSGNYNFSWTTWPLSMVQPRLEKINSAISAGLALVEIATPVEQALLRALECRNPSPGETRVVDDRAALFDEHHWAFHHAMKSVYEEFRTDLDVVGVYSDSIAVLAPWKLWDIPNGTPNPKVPTLELERVLEEGFTLPGGRDHPYLLHLYIHAMELSPRPEKAIFAADKLLDLVPDASHLIHMASHIDMLIGDYRRAIYSNAKAIKWDREWAKTAPPMSHFRFYGLHNYQVLIYAAMFSAQYGLAMQYTKEVEIAIPEDMVREAPDGLDGVYGDKFHVMVRFGKWHDILKEPFYEDQQLHIVTTIVQHYARGIAFSALGQVAEAEAELEELLKGLEVMPRTRRLYPNMAIDILQIAEYMLRGELAYRKGEYDLAFETLRKGIHHYDHLVYGEPWGWMQPVRHAYAALQLEQGNVEEAMKTYAADLGFDPSVPRAHQHPRNVWALHGYRECLRRTGEEEMARMIEGELVVALEVADVVIESSCFCRLTGEKGDRLYAGANGVGTSATIGDGAGGAAERPSKKVKVNTTEASEDCCGANGAK